VSEIRSRVFDCERDECASTARGHVLWTSDEDEHDDDEAVVPPPGWFVLPGAGWSTHAVACSEACALVVIEEDRRERDQTSARTSASIEDADAPEPVLVVSAARLRACLRCDCVERPRVNEWPVPADSTARICWCGTCVEDGGCEYAGEVDPAVRAFVEESREAGARDFPRAVVLPGPWPDNTTRQAVYRLAAIIPGWRPR